MTERNKEVLKQLTELKNELDCQITTIGANHELTETARLIADARWYYAAFLVGDTEPVEDFLKRMQGI